MPFLGSIGFLAPALLLGLLALPILWWLLRAVPPAAIKRRFPAVVLLLGLKDPENTPAKTPWWLLMLRMLALAAMIVGFAGPILNPKDVGFATGPIVVLTDASWASAPDWSRRLEKITSLTEDAARTGRPVAILRLSDPGPNTEGFQFQGGRDILPTIATLEPNPWEPDYSNFSNWLSANVGTRFETVWLSDGIERDNRAELARMLSDRGRLTVIETGGRIMAVASPSFNEGQIVADVHRPTNTTLQDVTLTAFGPDPAGVERQLASRQGQFQIGQTTLQIAFDLPPELRNRIRRFQIANQRSAGAVALTDDALKRRKIALFAGQRPREGQELVSPLHFLKKALAPNADLIEAPLRASLLANPDVVVLADVAEMTTVETGLLVEWVETGGLLLRFAGPKLAASSLTQDDDPLLPVRLRAGGRNVGGAMSWGAPKQLQPFDKGTPFFGLDVSDEIAVTSQVIAQPDPFLTERTLASLQDGTPLVTRKALGDGSVVLFHVTANAEWSNLPLSGLFVQMLERLSVSTGATQPTLADLEGQLWTPLQVMNGFGDLNSGDDLVAVQGEALASRLLGPDLLPGVYTNNDRQVALNVIASDRVLETAVWPNFVTVETLHDIVEQPLKAFLLTAALLALMLDILATLWLSGRLTGPREVLVVLLLLGVVLPANDAHADDQAALAATGETVLAYIKTGDARVDATSEAGLYGLSQALTLRTAVEPSDPMAIDLENDELSFFPLIYWPISTAQDIPSDDAYEKLNTYLRTGGMILFDTRDANLGGLGAGTENGRRLRQLADRLNIPGLEPIPSDHVLTRAFYLLRDFPGRHGQTDVWVEAAPKDAVRIEGVPFRNLNDGVTPVVIGGNDWASAWAMTRRGAYMYPVGRGGFAGERQREIAYRFGVNLVMYVLTGNYKSDQVHVPALLERLGQ